MFDVSFSELLVIAVVALLVIGPEKLPKVARTVGAFVGRMQRYMAQVKEEVNREMRFEELQKLQQEIKQSVETTEADIKKVATKTKPKAEPKPQAEPKPKTVPKPKAEPKPKASKSAPSKRVKAAAK